MTTDNDGTKEIPFQVKEELEKIAIKARKPVKDVHSLFNTIFNGVGMEYVADTLEERCEFALKQVNNDIFSTRFIEGSSVKVRMEFRVLHVSEVHDVKYKGKPEKTAYVTGVFKTSEDAYAGEPEFQSSFGILALRKDAHELVRDLKPRGSYRLELYVKVRCFYMELAKYSYEKPDICEVALPAPTEIILKAFTPLNVKEAVNNIGENRLLQGRLSSYKTWISNKNNYTGMTELTDFSDEKSKLRIMWFSTPEFATLYPVDSEVFILASISYTRNYGLSAQGRAIIPLQEISTERTPEELERISIEVFGEEWL